MDAVSFIYDAILVNYLKFSFFPPCFILYLTVGGFSQRFGNSCFSTHLYAETPMRSFVRKLGSFTLHSSVTSQIILALESLEVSINTLFSPISLEQDPPVSSEGSISLAVDTLELGGKERWVSWCLPSPHSP